MDFYLFNIVAQPTVNPANLDVMELISNAGPVVKAVLLILVFMSVVSWAIIFSKFIVLRSAIKKSEKFLDLYHASGNFGNLYSSTRHLGGPIVELFRAGYSEIIKAKKVRTNVHRKEKSPARGSDDDVFSEFKITDLVERALKKTMSSEVAKLESSLIFLATTGSTAPFIGLFGTVWGILTSFIGLSSLADVPTLQLVAPGIAEALIATAIGLAAAIPAAAGYNYFISKVRKIEVQMDTFASEFLNVVERYLNQG